MTVMWGLKSALVERFGSQVEAAKVIGIRESRLSYIIRGHVQVSKREREALERLLGKASIPRLLGEKS